MTQLLSYPFRIDPRGYAVTRDDASDAYYAEEISMLVQTQPGERVLQPAYGVDDPAFQNRFPTSELIMKTKVFGPPVEITDVAVNFPQDGIADVRVEFDTRLDLDEPTT